MSGVEVCLAELLPQWTFGGYLFEPQSEGLVWLSMAERSDVGPEYHVSHRIFPVTVLKRPMLQSEKLGEPVSC